MLIPRNPNDGSPGPSQRHFMALFEVFFFQKHRGGVDTTNQPIKRANGWSKALDEVCYDFMGACEIV